MARRFAKPWWRVLAAAAVALSLALVFLAYLRPDMLLTLGTQIWNCL